MRIIERLTIIRRLEISQLHSGVVYGNVKEHYQNDINDFHPLLLRHTNFATREVLTEKMVYYLARGGSY